MQIDRPVVTGRLLRRYKRFLCDVELDDGETLTAHCPNTGALLGCKEPGSRVVLRDSQNPERKLRYTWQAIEIDGGWVNVDTGLPNDVVHEAVLNERVPELCGYDSARREVRYGEGSRADLLLERGGERCWIEVKSTTLVRGRTALFPDAVTARGLKHLGELSARVAAGERAVQFFLVSRDDVDAFEPAADIDPAYAEGLREAAAAGVELLAWTVRVEPDSIELSRPLPIVGVDAD